MRKSVVFLGSGPYVIPIIQVLKKAFNLELVITTEQNSFDSIPSFCSKNKIPYLSVSNLSDSIVNNQLSIVNANVAVLAYFGLILPKKILNIFPKGIINVHPSLLPKYRGATPGQSAILNNEKATGVSIIKLDEEVDHGPILTQVEEPIYENDTAESLYKRLFKIGAGLIEDILGKYLEGKVKLRQQDHSKATFTKPFSKVDGHFDISKPPVPEVLNRMIRAYHPWPGVWTKYQFVQGSTRGVDARKIIKFLPEQKLQVEGKKPMSYKDFINGYSQGKEILGKLDLG